MIENLSCRQKIYDKLAIKNTSADTEICPNFFIVLCLSNFTGQFALITYIVVTRNAQRCQVKMTIWQKEI